MLQEADATVGYSLRLFSQDDEMSVPRRLYNTPEYKELMQLKEQRRQTLQSLDPSLPQHVGYKVEHAR